MPARFNSTTLFAVAWTVAASGFIASFIHFQRGMSATIQSIQHGALPESGVSLQPLERAHTVVMAALFVLLAGISFFILLRAKAENERQASALKACRNDLAQAQRQVVPSRILTGLAHHLATPLTFTKSNVFMAIQALDELAPGIRCASRMLNTVDTVVTAEASAPQALDSDPESVRALLNRYPDEIRVTQDMLTDVLMGLDQMEQLVNNLHLFSRLMRRGNEAVNLKTVLSNVASIARAVMPSNVKLVESGPDLPPVECDVAQLSHAFLTVILHAAQGMDGGGLVAVTTSLDGGQIRVRVDNTGKGHANEVLPRTVDPDFAVSPACPASEPGLSLARDIVGACGGRITVESAHGAGTAVQIEFPLNTHTSR